MNNFICIPEKFFCYTCFFQGIICSGITRFQIRIRVVFRKLSYLFQTIIPILLTVYEMRFSQHAGASRSEQVRFPRFFLCSSRRPNLFSSDSARSLRKQVPLLSHRQPIAEIRIAPEKGQLPRNEVTVLQYRKNERLSLRRPVLRPPAS